MRSQLNFNYIETFLTVARAKSFSRAADHLSIAQPVVSRQVKALEDHLGVQLLIREARNVALTKKGRYFFEKMSPLVNELVFQFDNCFEAGETLEGTLTFGCLREVGERLIFPFILEFKKRHPSLLLDIHYLKTHEIYEGIRAGDLDMGLVASKKQLQSIELDLVFKENIVMVGRSSQLSQKKALIRYRQDDILFDLYSEKFFKKKERSSIATSLLVNSHKSMVTALLELDAFAILPELSIATELKNGSLRQLSEKTLETNLFLAFPSFPHQEKSTQELGKFLKDSLSALASK